MMVRNASKIIETLYKAAGREVSWSSAFDQLIGYCGARGGVLYFADPQLGVQGEVALNNFNVGDGARYNREYKSIDPWRQALSRAEADRILDVDDVVDRGSLDRNAFYREVLQPNGVEHGVMAKAALPEGGFLVLGLHRSRDDGPANQEQVGRLGELWSHVARAGLLHHQLIRAQQTSTFVRSILDRQLPAIFVIGRQGRVIHLNAAASELVTEPAGLCVVDGTLDARPGRSAERLAAALGQVNRSDLDDSSRAVAFTLERLPGRPPLNVLVVTLDCEADSVGAAALVIAADTRLVVGPVPQHVRERYGFTDMESQVLANFVRTGDIATVAASLGIKISTARSHLKALLGKTDTHRQSELLGLFVQDLCTRCPSEAPAGADCAVDVASQFDLDRGWSAIPWGGEPGNRAAGDAFLDPQGASDQRPSMTFDKAGRLRIRFTSPEISIT